MQLRYTLLTDGSSDAALVPVINWLIAEANYNGSLQPAWAELRHLPAPPDSLVDKIQLAIKLYPCDILFIHRDAERESYDKRVMEIETAITEAKIQQIYICVIPIRMQEAWLIFDEFAIRAAAGNKNGKTPLNLPSVNHLESLPNPKENLHSALRNASGLSGRRLKRFNTYSAAHDVTDFISDFTPLYNLSAFQHLAEDVKRIIRQLQDNA